MPPEPRKSAPAEPTSEPDSAYASSAFYQMLHGGRRHDLQWYARIADESLRDVSGAERAVLDYGVGAGRVAIPHARAGHRVLGVDNAPAMLDACREALADEPEEVRDRVELVLGCGRAFRTARRFALVQCPFNGVAHHRNDAELHGFLVAAASHLAPGGTLAFDVLTPHPEIHGTSSEIPWFRHPARGTICRAMESIQFDASRQLLTIETVIRFMEEDREPEVHQLVLRQHRLDSLRASIERAGMRVDETDDLGDVIALVCRLR